MFSIRNSYGGRMERHDILIGVNYLILMMIIELSDRFSFSLVANLLVFSTYAFLYYDFANYKSHSHYALKREMKPSYGSLILAILILGIGRIITTYNGNLNYFSSTLPKYHLLEEYLFLIVFIILLIKFILKDLLEFKIKSLSNDNILPKTLTIKTSRKSDSDKNKKIDVKKEIEEEKVEIIKEKKEEKEEEMEEVDIRVKKLPVIVITTEE